MILSSIQLKNFRIHKEKQITFSEKLNYIVGGNGVGKTTILESIYYLCTTKGYNSRNDGEAISFNEDCFEIAGVFNDRTEDKIRIHYSGVDNKKYYFSNEKQIFRSADIIGKFPVVILTPFDHTITQGAPGERRKFVDSVISQASDTYLKFLLDYNKTLKQRGSLLFRMKEGYNRGLHDELDAWTEKLVITGISLIEERERFIGDFKEHVERAFDTIIGNNEIPGVEYNYFNVTEGDIKQQFSKLIEQKRKEEIRRGQNLVGPHRDDFTFTLNDKKLKVYGSQGQHKTFQVALRFAQFFYLKEATGKTPIFLLDDIFGELDAARAAKISEFLRNVGQAFITLTDLANISFLTVESCDQVIKLGKEGNIYA